MFGDVSKIMLFEAKLWIKVVCFACKANRDSNENFIPLSNLVQYHESIGGLRIVKWATIEKLIFRVMSLCTILCVILMYMLSGFCFRNRAHPRLILTSRIWFWAQISILANEWKFYFLDYFALRVENCESEFGSGCKHTKGTVGLVWEVETQILNFLWVSLLFYYSFGFIEKRNSKIWLLELKSFW